MDLVSTPYDDVFRTLLNDCRSLIIPLINEAFGEHYTGEETVLPAPEIHFMNQSDGEEEKRITDSSFTIRGAVEKDYLLECQSTADNSMLVRIFEYATQIGLDRSVAEGDRLTVTIPHSAILFLRSNRNTPDGMEIELRTPGGNVIFTVPVIKLAFYTVEEIFEKKLLLLLPFYIFVYEKRFQEYEKNPAMLETLVAEYEGIAKRLEKLQETGELTTYTRKILQEMTGKVVEHLAVKYDRVREGVKSVMGGKVLDYEAKTIWMDGVKHGMDDGIKEGIFYTLFDLVGKDLLSVEDAASQAGVSKEDFVKKMRERNK